MKSENYPGSASLRDIYLRAIEKKTPEARAAFLDGACGDDLALRNKVEALLRENAEDSFLEHPAIEGATLVVPTPLTEGPGTMIGRYKLLQKVGEGGMGVVYMAEQTEPVTRKVALKIIKLGMDTKQVVARFEAERQALAMMDHPNIAKVLDAGATDPHPQPLSHPTGEGGQRPREGYYGRPFFVMELVRGVPITEYCDKNKLSTQQRLELFIPVCQAIQHAHQKGVIHRDIKPSNVMVTLHDGNPVPKVIDFGIAKATNQKLTEKTLFTNYAQMIGTPAYMSPEQAEMSGLDVDTRTDVYSLGVLLYELLTGTTPFPSKELLSLGYGQMQKVIAENEPPKPSTRLSTMQHEERTVVAKNRNIEEAALGKMFKGDLDWIVMKALEKDRTRRYETVNGLAADIKRHLNNEPVTAAAPTFRYQLSKFARRNRKHMRVAVAAAALLLIALVFSAVQAVRATRATVAAEAARKADQKSEAKAREAQTAEAKLRDQAEAQARAEHRRAYASDMRLLQQELEMNNLGQAQTLLERQIPGPGQVDLRGWDWRYLWSQARADEHEVLWTGGQRVLRMSASVDGRWLAWSDGGKLAVMDLSSRRIVLERQTIGEMVFAHRVPWLAYTTRDESNRAFRLHVLDVAAEKEIKEIASTNTGRAMELRFAPDDRTLLAASQRGELRLIDVWTGQTLWQNAVSLFPGGGWLERLSISPDGRTVALAVNESKVTVFDLKDGKERFTIKATDDLLTAAVQFSPDSSMLLTTGGYADPAIRLWDARDGHPIGKIEGHRSSVTSLVFTQDGRKLISSSCDYTIRVWDWPERRPAGVLRGHLDEVWGLVLLPDGRSLASRSKDGAIYLWDLTRLHEHGGYRILPDTQRVHEYPEFTFSANGQFIVQLHPSGPPQAWDVASLRATSLPGTRLIRAPVACLSPDGTQFIAADLTESLAFQVVDARSGLQITNFPAPPDDVGPPMRNPFLYLREGGVLVRSSVRWVRRDPGLVPASLSFDLWDTVTWRQRHIDQPLRRFFGDSRRMTLRPLSVPGFFALIGVTDILLLDVTQPDLAPRIIELPRPNTALGGFAASPDGSTAAIATEDGYVTILDWKTLKVIRTFKGFLQGAHSAAYSPDGRRLAVGGSGNEAVKLWDSDSWEELLTLRGEGSMFTSLQFSPDGRLLLGANMMGQAHVWTAPTMQEIAAIEPKDTAGGERP
jgi:serine/threonine protein kinase/WD40 repeat protein